MTTASHPAPDLGLGSPHATDRYDRWFFGGMTVLLLAITATAFAPSYYLAGMIRAPLPSAVVHVHAIVASAWLLLVATQVTLVNVGRIDLHRTLGAIGFALAIPMAVTGLLAGADTLRRDVPPGAAHVLFMLNVGMVIGFTVSIALAFRARRAPAAHKRWILAGNVAIAFAAFIRAPIPALYHDIPAAARAPYALLLLLVLYDVWSARRIHPVTLRASVFLVAVFEAPFVVADTRAWQAVTSMVRALGS